MFQSDLAVHQELLQIFRLLPDLQVDELPELVGVAEIQELAVPVVGIGDKVQKNPDDLQQEIPGVLVSIFKVLAYREQA